MNDHQCLNLSSKQHFFLHYNNSIAFEPKRIAHTKNFPQTWISFIRFFEVRPEGREYEDQLFLMLR